VCASTSRAGLFVDARHRVCALAVVSDAVLYVPRTGTRFIFVFGSTYFLGVVTAKRYNRGMQGTVKRRRRVSKQDTRYANLK